MKRTAALLIAVIASVAIVGGVYWLLAHGIPTLPWGDKSIDLAAPIWLYGLAVVPFFYAFTTFSLTDLSLAQHILQATLRTLVVTAAILALARPQTTSRSSRVAIAILVDVSASVTDEQIDSAKQYIAAVEKSKAEGTAIEVITFAGQARKETKNEGTWQLSRHSTEAKTDIESALHLAYGVLPAGYVPQVILLSDGNHTEGSLVTSAGRAQSFGIPISWGELPESDAVEVRVQSISAPTDVRAGEPFNVTVELWSSREQEVTVFLKQDDFANPLAPKITESIPAGRSTLKFKSKSPRAGVTRYTATIQKPTHDTQASNNTATFIVPVIGKPNVLYVEGGLLRDRNTASYLRRALEAQHIDVEVRGPRSLPTTVASLKKFDMVIVSDVAAKLMSLSQMNTLDRFVRSEGGGLVMAGGEDSFGSGGYQGTKIEKLLPVRFDSETIREQPNVAIVLVIDRSGSMSGAKIEAAKTSARATSEVLSSRDLIAVVAHDSRPEVIVRLQRAANRTKISNDIGRIRPGGGTHIAPALREAHNILQNASAKVKHVIVLSDGQAPYQGIADLCDDMRSSGITISAVGIGDADKDLLTLITDHGEGRLYLTQDLSRLPRIFAQETSEAQRNALVEEPVAVRVVKRTALIEGTGVDKAPPLKGYVSVKAKPTADLVLAVNTGEPLLASWRVGAGTAIAWTSDVKNRWSVNWLRWPGYSRFWAQLVRSSMRKKAFDSYDITSTIDGDQAIVTVNALDNNEKFVNKLSTELLLVDPKSDKVVKSLAMPQVAAGMYQAAISMNGQANLIAKAIHKRDGRKVAESVTALSIPYPSEFSTTESNISTLDYLAEATGGISAAKPEVAAKIEAAEPIIYTAELWPWVLLFAGLLLILDLYSKRVRLFGYRAIKFS